MKECPVNNITKKLKFMENYLLNNPKLSPEKYKDLKHKLSYIKSQFKARWLAAHKKDVFLKNNDSWLQGTVEIPIMRRTDRPTKSFKESSECSKRRKTQDLREHFDTEELTFATQMKLRATGNLDASKVIKDITESLNRATKYRKAFISRSVQERSQLSPLQALSIFVEANLSRRQYEIIRTNDKKLYPCYSILQRAKKDCYPIRESYKIIATCAEINLQDLLNHTIERLTLYLQEILQNLNNEDRNTLELIYKWGCDGSQQVQHKQKFENISDSDTNLFQSCLVPLQLISGKNEKKIKIQHLHRPISVGPSE